MSTSSIPTVLDALVDALKLRPGLSGVGVFAAPAGDSGPVECLEFTEIELEEEARSMGGNRLESYTLKAAVFTISPGAGAVPAGKARERALAIVAEVETYMNDDPTIGGTCLDSDFISATIKQGYTPEGRVCQTEITIRVQAMKNP